MYSFKNIEPLYVVLIACLIYVLYLNLNKNIFLGDSGSLFLGCLFGFNLIYNYNLEISNIRYPVENIFIVLMLIGLDMLRVFIIRIFNKKNPFLPDRTHLHHLLLQQKIKLNIVLMIFFFLILLPIIINQFLNFSKIKIILFYIFFYCIFIIMLKKKSFNN